VDVTPALLLCAIGRAGYGEWRLDGALAARNAVFMGSKGSRAAVYGTKRSEVRTLCGALAEARLPVGAPQRRSGIEKR
jgi:hypothetical protein